MRAYLLATLAWNVFLPWYLLQRPVLIVNRYLGYARTWAEIFSFVFLLRTLVAPWKSITDAYPDNMLALGRVLQVFTLNMTARSVGLVVRLIALCVGVAVQVLLFLSFAAYLLFWILFPLLLAGGIQWLLLSIFIHL